MGRNNWSAATKQQALEVYAEHGLLAASEATGVPRGTIKSWASRMGVEPATAERVKARRDATVARVERSLAERRVVLVAKLGEIAELGVDWAAKMLEQGDDLSMRDVVGAWTRAIHDLQLLSGEATDRSETLTPPDAIDAEIADLVEAMRRRDAAA